MQAILSRILTGLLIVAAGVALLLSNLEVVAVREFAQDWWPLIIIGAGLTVLISDVKSYLWALVIMIAGGILQLNVLGIIDVNFWQLVWPTIIIVVGLSVMLNVTAGKKTISKGKRGDITAILSGHETNVRSQDFQGSKVTAIMGGVVIDLRDAVIKKEAVIEVFTLWGGVELRVPKNVIIKNDTTAILGGTENSTRQDTLPPQAPTLRIVGDVIMAGIEIKN